ncbi:MAG TPA: DNA methyltransferase, partial [Anaeromyxobacteraceae bacterium]|nr:DNA methyltransferase [Anaeromyxobacteraceae bacterium]
EILDVDDATALRILIADNRIADLGTYSDERLAQVLAEILEQTSSLSGTGYDADDLDQLLADLSSFTADVSEVSDDPWEAVADRLVQKWGTDRGQLWTVPSITTPGAAHRIGCGDSRDPELVARVMNGTTAQLLFTDPPYGVEYEASPKHKRVQNDDLHGRALQELLELALRAGSPHLAQDAAVYVWHADKDGRRAFERALENAGFQERQYLIWAKESFVLGRSTFHYQHEAAFYGGRAGVSPKHYGDRTQSTVWRITPRRGKGATTPIALDNIAGLAVLLDEGVEVFLSAKVPDKAKIRRVTFPEKGSLLLIPNPGTSDLWEIQRDPRDDYLHPTQKPAALAARGIVNSTAPGDVVLDLFAGGGFVAVAAEQTGRLSCSIDYAPGAVAATLEQLERLGLEPELEDAKPRKKKARR